MQCTEEKPSCKRCERLGLQCVRGIRLLFREDAIERGIHFGREGKENASRVTYKDSKNKHVKLIVFFFFSIARYLVETLQTNQETPSFGHR